MWALLNSKMSKRNYIKMTSLIPSFTTKKSWVLNTRAPPLFLHFSPVIFLLFFFFIFFLRSFSSPLPYSDIFLFQFFPTDFFQLFISSPFFLFSFFLFLFSAFSLFSFSVLLLFSFSPFLLFSFSPVLLFYFSPFLLSSVLSPSISVSTSFSFNKNSLFFCFQMF